MYQRTSSPGRRVQALYPGIVAYDGGTAGGPGNLGRNRPQRTTKTNMNTAAAVCISSTDESTHNNSSNNNNNNANNGCVWNVRIVWSTESGRAKACARRTARILRESYQHDVLQVQSVTSLEHDEVFRHLLQGNQSHSASQSEVATMGTAEESSQLRVSQNTVFVCFISTTGDGEQCESIRPLWKSL